METEPVSIGDTANAFRANDHSDIIFPRKNRRMAEPPANLEPESRIGVEYFLGMAVKRVRGVWIPSFDPE